MLRGLSIGKYKKTKRAIFMNKVYDNFTKNSTKS